jgi:hypothetical protein
MSRLVGARRYPRTVRSVGCGVVWGSGAFEDLRSLILFDSI